MRITLLYVLIFLLSGAGSYYFTLYYLPYYIVKQAKQKMQLKDNHFLFTTQTEASQRRQIVRPNPDFAYCFAFYNLENGPQVITGNFPESNYFSISFFDQNSSNYYVRNDLQFKSNQVHLILGVKKQAARAKNGEEWITAPTAKGVVLTRFLITQPEKLKKITPYLKSFRMKAYR